LVTILLLEGTRVGIGTSAQPSSSGTATTSQTGSVLLLKDRLSYVRIGNVT
jgi:hypothetical protein